MCANLTPREGKEETKAGGGQEVSFEHVQSEAESRHRRAQNSLEQDGM